jgi:hypothetical protein
MGADATYSFTVQRYAPGGLARHLPLLLLLHSNRGHTSSRFDYKRPLFQCNDFALKKRTMLKKKGCQSAN